MSDNIIFINQLNKKTILEELLDKVVKKSFQPEDIYEIAAIVESFGWNDSRAAEVFGVENIFELSSLLWEMIKERKTIEPFVEEKKETLKEKTKKIAKSFLRGVIFGLPMAISVISMLTLRFSLWSYEYLSVELATSIAIGTILSFITVGGFTQAIARRGFFYISQGFYGMAKQVTYYLVKLGYAACIIVSIFYIIFNTFFKNFPYYMFFVTVLYYFFLCAIWLSVTVMYMLQKEFTFTGLIVLGIIIVLILFKLLGLNIILSQIMALTIVSILGLIVVIYYFNQAEHKLERGIQPPFPSKSILLYSLKPYFLYGFFYFTFLFIDRLMAWSANSAYMPYIIWFRGEYELGLDFALLMLIFPLGVSEVIISRLMENLETLQMNGLHRETDVLGSIYVKNYLKSLATIFFTAVISGVLIFLGALLISKYGSSVIKMNYFENTTTYFVFIIALISYAILSIGLTNEVILFSISQPDMGARIMGVSLFINFIVGFAMSRWINYSWAIIGLLVGSIAFAVISTRCVLKVMNNFDYYIYVAT
jgi:hypothetical protein